MSSTLKILHTADWHLGHQLHGYARYDEHQAFLNWLLDQIEIQQVDVLCMSGDVFDSANPSSASWQQLYRFLATLMTQSPGVQVILTAGNHDSPSKMSAPGDLLAHFDLHFIGHIEKDEQGEQQFNKLLVPLKNRQGEIHGWALAVPFLRASDLVLDREIVDGQQRWQHAIADVYQQVAKLAESVREEGQMLMAMGHAHVRGGQVSELSERQIIMGGEHALPADIFPDGCDYVALGHLHLGQQITHRLAIHYSGSPLPLSLSERRYHHHIQLLTWDEQSLTVEPLSIPRVCPMWQVPDKPQPIEQVLQALRELTEYQGPVEFAPFVEVQVALDKPQVHLREQVMRALEGKNVRLTRIRTVYPAREPLASASFRGKDLDDLTPLEVFTLCYEQNYQQDPPEALCAAFKEVMAQVEEK